MTKLYTWVFNAASINVQEFSFIAPLYLNVDIEYFGSTCIGYEELGRYTFNYKENRLVIYLAEDFSDLELDVLRLNLEGLSKELGCFSISENIYFKQENELILA